MVVICSRCPVPVEAVGFAKRSLCLEHLVEAWRREALCRACGYYVATVGDLCDACAGEP